MPFIKVRKPGVFGEAFLGEKAYDLVEVDETGVPITVKAEAIRNTKPTYKSAAPVRSMSGTEPKIAPGVRAPDTAKGYSKPFNYHQWNAIRKLKKR